MGSLSPSSQLCSFRVCTASVLPDIDKWKYRPLSETVTFELDGFLGGYIATLL